MTTPRNVRVLSVIGHLYVGGAENYLTRIARDMKGYGVDMEVCALEKAGPKLTELEDAGIRVHGTPYPTRAQRSNTLTLVRTVDAIRRIVRDGRFDAVHTYLFWSDVLGVAGARLAGCRRIIVSRRAMHSWAHSQSAFFHGLEQVSNMMADELIANSKAVLADAEAHEGRLPRVRTVIYNGIDVEDYQPAQPSQDGRLRLVTVGALAPRKGQEYAIEATSILVGQGLDVTLDLVGAGPDEERLRARVADAHLEGRVSFAGEEVDPRRRLACADIFVLPSRQEGFSNAILEAMASSLPVVATDVGGNAEAVVDGDGGFIVPPENAAALAAAISRLAKDRTRLAECGRYNRRRVAEKFSLEASARQLAGWYLDRGAARNG
jgi:glycosyltransferase involved in cell wall biosynthesis